MLKFIQNYSSNEKCYISCPHYHFCVFKKHLARFTTPLIAEDTNKLTENERNTDRCTTESSEKGLNGYRYIGANDLIGIYLRAGREWPFNINNEPYISIILFWTRMYKNYLIFLKHCLALRFDGITFV